MARGLALTSLCLLALCASHAQRSNTLYGGLGSAGLQAGIEQQYSDKFSYVISASYLYLKPLFFTRLAGEYVSVKSQVNTPQTSIHWKWNPWGKKRDHEYRGLGCYLFGGVALRFNPNYTSVFTFKDALTLGSFILTPDETGKVEVNVKTNYIQPFMGLGSYIRLGKSPVGISVETGMMYHGKPKLNMQSTGTLQFNDRNEAQIQKNISGMRLYPWINLLVGYKLNHS